jgi:23S rRNA (pseudouridine1915-N3)-methyltransferase
LWLTNSWSWSFDNAYYFEEFTMLLKIIGVGKLKEKYLREGVAEYTKRLQAYARVQHLEISDQKIPEGASPAEEQQVLMREGEGILKHLTSQVSGAVVVLDRQGKSFSSEELAQWMQKIMLGGQSEISWIIGGTLGLDSRVLERADLRLSFSRLTFPHQLMRLILVEQIYRSFKILRNEPYHR